MWHSLNPDRKITFKMNPIGWLYWDYVSSKFGKKNRETSNMNIKVQDAVCGCQKRIPSIFPNCYKIFAKNRERWYWSLRLIFQTSLLSFDRFICAKYEPIGLFFWTLVTKWIKVSIWVWEGHMPFTMISDFRLVLRYDSNSATL